jgi:hypothetical protein
MQSTKPIIVFVAVLVILAAIVFLFWRAYWIPAKYAIKEAQFSQFENYILVKEVHYTGTGWTQIGDEKGYFSKEDIKDVYLTGEKLPETQMALGGKPVTFLCIVEYEGKIDHAAFIEAIDSFKIIEWYPVYPITRSDTMFPSWMYPPGFLTENELRIY